MCYDFNCNCFLFYICNTRELAKAFSAHILEKVDNMAGEKGFVIVVDNNGGGMSNINLDHAKFMTSVMEYYPLGARAIYSVDLPWLLNSIMKLIISFMSAKVQALVHFINHDDLLAYVDEREIPLALKGKREKAAIPTGLETLHARARELELSDNFVDTFYKTMKIARPNE